MALASCSQSPGDLDEIFMRRRRILMRATQSQTYAGEHMPGDLIAIILGIVAFAVLYLIIEGIDRV